jgi:uncharacterized protein (TIGR00661 family)
VARILYGICGIGLGHTLRQLPIIEQLAKRHRIAVFAYGKSYEFFAKRNIKNVKVFEVAVPFYVSGKNGIDFSATAAHPANKKDFVSINCTAFAKMQHFLKAADLVITDYEPVSAQYAYANSIPLVTIDQQSKYLGKEGFEDEEQKLRMFFPKADLRIACSFFRIKTPGVLLVPPPMREEIRSLKRRKTGKILVYLSSQQEIAQSPEEIVSILGSQQRQYVLFAQEPGRFKAKNIDAHSYDAEAFLHALAECDAIITTAGHSLLAEAMYLGIPVYALPLPVGEQQMNAAMVARGHGVASARLEQKMLERFLHDLPRFATNIRKSKLLLRKDGKAAILKRLQRWL